MKKGEVENLGIVASLAAWIVAGLFVFGFLVLAVKLKEVQVADSAKYDYEKARQSVRRVQTAGARGRILDRNGVILAANRPAVNIVCQPAAFQKKTWEESVEAIRLAIDRLGTTLGHPSSLAERTIRRHVRQSLAMPLVVWRDIDERELAIFAEHAGEFPGFDIEETTERVYPNGRLAAHILGYVGHDRGQSVAGDEKFNFSMSEMRGRAGLEYYYDGFLCGVHGEEKVLVDARGFAIRDWTVAAGRTGPDLRLSIDATVQAAVEHELAGEKGGCAVIDPRTGEVLALASAPDYDPNEFVPVLQPEVLSRYADDPAKPLLNRASGGTYAPGSTFKPITALAGLAGGLDAAAPYECIGVYTLGSLHLRCAMRWGHGSLDLRHAIMKSCNPYFCDLGMKVGTNALTKTARAFGLGERTGLDLAGEANGVVPDGEWKQRVFHERWYPGDLAQLSIGQSMLLVTPLQMACVAGALGTGYLVTPHLKLGLPAERRNLPFPRADLQIVREGMHMVVYGDTAEGSRGSGWRAGENVNADVCGKTGTAEVGRGERRRKNTWFIAYAPAENPEIAVALVIENGESGGGTAAPRVGAILRSIFGTKPKNADPQEGTGT